MVPLLRSGRVALTDKLQFGYKAVSHSHTGPQVIGSESGSEVNTQRLSVSKSLCVSNTRV